MNEEQIRLLIIEEINKPNTISVRINNLENEIKELKTLLTDFKHNMNKIQEKENVLSLNVSKTYTDTKLSLEATSKLINERLLDLRNSLDKIDTEKIKEIEKLIERIDNIEDAVAVFKREIDNLWYDAFGIGTKTRNLSEFSLKDEMLKNREEIREIKSHYYVTKNTLDQRIGDIESALSDIEMDMRSKLITERFKRLFARLCMFVPKPIRKLVKRAYSAFMKHYGETIGIGIALALEALDITNILESFLNFLRRIF